MNDGDRIVVDGIIRAERRDGKWIEVGSYGRDFIVEGGDKEAAIRFDPNWQFGPYYKQLVRYVKAKKKRVRRKKQ